MNLPALYKRTSTGKIQMWNIWVESVSSESYSANDPTAIVTLYGLVDGKKQEAREVITAGKNIGKANETRVLDQAIAEAKSQWEKKVKKGYVESLDDAEQGKINTDVIVGGVVAMLAHQFDKQGHKIKFPAYVQPKLDGHRCLAVIQNGKATLWSRERKPIHSMPHIVAALEKAYPDKTLVLDGELYNHDYREKFEELSSKIRQSKPVPGHEVVQYWVYDLVSDEPFAQRALDLADLALGQTNGVVIDVATAIARDKDEMVAIFGVYVEAGYEGLMVRNSAGTYKHGRSYDLQKVKLMQDAEFEIVDVTEGKGKMAGKAMFHVVTADGKPFRVKMKGTLDSLTHYLDHKEDYIGKELTVRYQNLSSDGIPRFPIGLRVREDV